MRFGGLGRCMVVAMLTGLAAGCVGGCSIKSADTKGTATTEADSKSGSDTSPSAKKPGQTAETVSAEGSSTVYLICQAFAVEFENKFHHSVSVGRQGTGGGYNKFVVRQADIWNASRPIDKAEVAELQKKGIGWLELNIALDGIVIAVNPQNTWCSHLTCAQLKRIWEPDSKVRNWSDLDPAWPAEAIVLFGADTDSGTFEYFTEVINDKKKATNTNYTPSSDDNVLIQGIATNKNALGYVPFGYYIENTEKVKPLGVSPTKDSAATPAPYVNATVETILSGEYAPLARPLYMYANLDSLKRPEVASFLKFATSEEAQPLIEKRGFVRMKEEVRQQMQEKLGKAISEPAATKSE